MTTSHVNWYSVAYTKQKTHTQLLFICGWKVPNSDTDMAVAYLSALPRCGHLSFFHIIAAAAEVAMQMK